MNFHGISYWGSIDVISHFFTFVSADSGDLPPLKVQPKQKPIIIIIIIIISSSSSSWEQAIQARSVLLGVGL
jgi:hypothetical protein